MLREVHVENGIVQGLPAADPRITSFKGIPFAAPPVGENRWRAPQPVQNWDGKWKAYDFAPMSMQAPTVIDINNIYSREWAVDPNLPMNEDCLYLNVWTPAKQTDELLPVFVWYFGGGFQVGHTAEMEFDGERIARRGIVVVTVNYRLNAFGFLSHPEITAESPDAPANFGHLDQQAGTQWVKRNIAAFGGDPNQITIGGQSAGGGSVLSQLTSPQNEGLFQRVVIMSGVFTPLYPNNPMPPRKRSLKAAEEDGASFFEFIGVSTLEEARKLDAVYIRDKMLEFGGLWGTVVDHQYCNGNPYDLLLKGQFHKVPIMLGNTASEFLSVPAVSSVDEFRAMAVEMFGEEAEEYLKLFAAHSENVEELISQASVNHIEYAARVSVKANSDSGNGVPMYYYTFDADIPGWDNPGTFHSVDLWFHFETLAKCWRPFVGKHYDLARQMCNYLANFISTGDPNGKDSTGEDMPSWKPCTAEAPYGMKFADKAEFVAEPPSEVMQFLVRQYFRH
ncbi:carboxylesterase family protein [Paenibacillus sp. KS-LC4]|uniref:carboxylesterase/lipase family protein n=1 Tax=Paenibacillus sp. KS-LC4 TaxID=2979727 RepID=UPI0030D4E026